ncbi:Muscle M-line assembly protein unc-89 [Papilio machaon]|uniref:Muscle M-line assembly protein unc-89 n=1 Tax=Papilio machaon TaxID=76193 RepID=A0A194QZQ9_PAPMA|nr:Muscle M-line assembly protein unc-89 [Papilio machaon]
MYSCVYNERSRAGASLDDRFRASEDAGGVRLTVSAARTGDSGIYTLQASNAAGKDTRRLRLEVSAEETPSGDDPPTFLRRLQDLTVKVGTRTRFLVEIVSSTECKVTWYRNERRLMEAERVSLVRDGNFWCADVAAVSVDDAGRWTCTAENIGGRASCSAHLNVLVPKAYKRPEFVEELRAVLTEQGTVSLECKVVGVPTPILRWFKDSREIKAGDVFALTANAEDPTSLGTYTCEAVNCMGRAYSSSKVHVIGRGSRDGSLRPGQSGGVSPEPSLIFTKELEAQSVKICDPLTLSCHIVVPPWPRSVVWYNKEGKIEPNERYHVTEDGVGGYLVEVTSSEWRDEGEWKCVATSAGGRLGITTCYVTMEVPKNFRKPRFMENLQAILTEEGLVSFECKVVGFPTPVLSWFKDGQELKPGDVYQLTGTNSLGSYCCIARNCMGQASSSAELTVEDIQNQLNEEEKLQLFSKNQAPKFLQGLKSMEARIDEPFRFTVKVAIPPEPSVLWYRDDQPVDDSPRCHLDKEEKGGFFLDIRNLEFLDQAEWKCVAINDFGHSVTSCFLKLIIPRHYKKPRFLENLQAILSDEGAVNLECKVIGVPQPVLKWYKDGEELKPGDIHRIISGQDGTCCLGTYTCEAQNCMGIAASSASLLGFDDSTKTKSKKKIEEQTLQRNLSLSTIHEERTSQMYDTPVGDITLDDKGEISFSFDGKEVSVSLYETPDLTEEEALQIVEMYADQLSENITEHNVVELPPLRFVKETSNSGNLLMEAIIIDVSPEYFASPEEDLRTEADIEDISIADENVPSQLSFDQDLEDKYLPVISDDKYEISQQLNRKKSDSQKSADEYFSLSRDHSLSEEKRDDNTEVISESDLLSFASAHSSGKPKTKTNKISPKVAIEPLEGKNDPRIKSERKSSCSSRRSSTESEKSLTKRREDMIEKQINPIEQTIPKNKLKETVVSISTSLDILVKDVQKLENEIILKSEYMSSIITASKSVEIINSVLSPLSEINTIIDELNVCLMENSEVNTCLYNVAQSLKSLQQALTIIEKCIDVESENKTLVKKTCVLIIEKCGNQFQELMRLMKLIKTNGRGIVDNKVLFDIESISNEIITIVNFTAGTIKTNNLLIEADKLQVEELSIDVKHLRDTQKGIQELKRPLISLLNIVKNAELETSKEIPYINDSSVILADMSASIQDLQFALEQIEVLSIKEDSIPLNKYNTEIINSVLNPVLELRNSFEQLSAESKYIQDKTTLNQKLASVKSNINVIFSHLSSIEENVGAFDILQNDNKLETLQKMANILILLESNLTILDHVPSVKEDLSLLHKKLTKILENVIESNEAKKYYDFVEVCDVVKGINNFIQNDDSHGNLNLASISNALNIIKDCLVRNIFDPDLNKSVITIISKLQISIQEKLNQEEHETFNYEYEYLQLTSEHVNDGSKAKSVMEHIERTLVSIATVTSYQSVGDSNTAVLQPLENVVPVLEELKNVIASMNFSGMECVEHVSEITEVTSQSVEILAKPLFEINRHVSVLSEVVLEDPESIKGNHPVSIFAQALNELCETLEILQHDIISQLGEYLHRSFSLNFADTVQSLHSAILMIQNNVELEVPDELSTLEDISGLKTTADTVQSDHLAIPIIEHKKIQEILDPTTELTPKSSLVHILHLLNKQIILLQNPQIEEILEKISKSKLPHSLSLPTELANLQSVIQEILHPMISQSSENVLAVTTITEIGSLSESMIALQQMLSQIITENIPSLEGIVDISSDLIHSVHLSIAELRDHLDKCIKVIFPALNVADITINVSNNIATLKETCELLCDLIADSSTSTKAFNEKLKTLNFTTKQLLDAFDGSKKIDIKKIKHLIEELYKESLYVEEDILSLAPLSIKEMEEEAHLLEALHKIESSITILEQYEYISLSNTFNLHNCTPQRLKEIDPQILCQLDDILITTSNVMHNLENHYEVQEDIKSFIAMCQKKIVILRSLINKNFTYKGIIRLYQEFIFMHNLVNLFKENILVLSMSRDVEQVVTEFLKNINNVLDRVRICVIKILEKKMELIFTTPKKSLTNNCEKLAEDVITVGSSDLTNLLQAFLNAKEIILPSLYDLDVVIIKDLNLKVSNYEISKTEENIINEWENFEIIFEKYILMNLSNANQKQQMDKANQCIQRYHNVKDSIGRAKQLILLQCMAECSEILKDIVLGSKELQNVKLQQQQLLEISLSQIYTELFVLCEKLKGNNKKILAKNTDASLDSYIFNLNEKLCKFIVELEQTHRLIITSEVKLIILKVCNEIHSVKKHLKSLEGQIIPMTINNFVNTVDKIEKLITVIFSQEAENVQIQEIGKLMDHINEFVSQDTIEVINKIAISSNVIDADKTVKLATELKENISAIMLSPEIHLSEDTLIEKLSDADVSLAFELQQALLGVITEIYEKAEELSSQFDGINVQQVQSNLTSLSSDLNVLITSAQVVEKTDDVKQAVVENENAIVLETDTEGEAHREETGKINVGKMMEHINEFVSQDTIEVINKIAISSNVIDADKTVKLATELKENISAIMLPPEIHLSEETLKENLSKSDISLAFELQQALSIVTTEIYEKAEELASQFDGINVQQVQSNLTSLSSDLNALITSAQVVEKTNDIKEAVVETENAINLETVTEGVTQKVEREELDIDDYETKNTLHNLKSLLKEVSDKINMLATSKTAEEIETLQNTLDEIQAVIIALKRDYIESVNDTLNESLQDLECSVRSVQLLINEESPPELVKEACETLQLLVSNMCEMHEFQVVPTTSHKEKLSNIIRLCSNDTEETIHLLESALSMKSDNESEFDRLYTYVNELKLVIKSLKVSFADNSENLIEKGIEIMQNLDQIEDQVFGLEKEVDIYKNLTPIQRDSIVTAIHSVYGSISNMRSAMSSVQKHYMYENYGKSSELILNALKSITFIANKTDKKWKTLSKSLRKVLNHFEDIKFYINFDKTARIPGDAAFTKIILLDLKAAIESLIFEHDKDFGEDITFNTKCVVECLEMNLLKMESKSNLQVKEKIPIFKSIGKKICALASSIKEYLEVSEKKENINTIEALQCQDSFNIATNKLFKESLLVQGPIDGEHIEDALKDVLRVSIEKMPFIEKDSHENFSVSKEEKDAIQYSSNIIKNVKVPSGDLNSTDVIDKKEKTENTGFTINTHAVDFTLEILPETIMTENIPEVSTLNLEASKPLEAPLLQIIDTGILYKAHVNEAVIGFVLDSDSKEGHAISQDSKEFKEIEKEKPVINQTPEVEPKFEETSTLIDHINETNKRLKKDIMIDESQCVTSKEFLPIEEISEPTDEQGISSHVDKKSEHQEHDFVAEKIGEDISQKFGSADENDVDIENTIQKDKMIVGRENEKHLENYDKFENNIMKANKCDLVIDREILDDKNAVKKSDRLFDEENNEMNFTLAPKAIHELDSLKQINNVRSCIENEMNAGDNNEMTPNKAIANAEISEKEQDNESLILNIQKLTTEVKSGVKILQDVNETVEIKVDSNSQIPLLEGTKLDTNDDKKIPIKQEVKEVLQSTNLLGEVVQKSSSDEDVVSQIITLKQTITNDDQLKENFENQNKEEKTVLDPKAEKSSNIIGYKNEDKTEMENIGTNKERNCTDEEATTNKHLSDKEKPKHKKKDVRSKKQVQSPQIAENKVEESKSSEVKEVNVFQQKDTLKTEEELIHKSIEDVKEKPNENQSSEVSKTIDNIILDKVSVQDRQSEEKIRKDKVENKNIDVETNLFMKNVSDYQREDIQISETLKSNNANIEGIQNITFFEKNDNVDNTNEFDLQLDSNIKRQVDEHNGVIFKELEDPTLEQINMRKLKKIEVTSYDKLYSNEAVSVDNSFKSADTTTKNNAVFVDRTRNYYENEFLRPPGYVERTFNNDHSNSELDITQSYPFYKAQTIVRNTQYDSPLNTCQIQSNEAVDRRDVSHKLNALNETRSFITEKRSKLLRDVKRKPVFSTYLTDRTAVEGSRVKLTCSVLTTLEPKIVWFKNGVPLDNKFKYRTKSIDGLLTMEVLNAEPSDSAEYSCTVETENGSVTTSAILKVYPSFEVSPIPPTFTRSIRDKYHHAENELVLECRIRGQPLPTITWLKDDRLINITDRYQAYYLADGVCRLTISNPSSEDSGKYTCKAENSMWSDQINHIVTFTGIESRFGLHSTSGESSRINRQSSEARRPHFTNVLTDYKVSSGGTIGLQVEIKGSPTRVEWLREGHAITDRNAQTFVDHGLYTLALSDVTEKESGIYTCRAWSKQGNVDMTAAITVVEPNEIDGKPAVIIGRPQRDVLISVGEDINISFRVQGEPKPKVTLMKGIRDITNSPRVCKMKSDDYMKFTLKRSVISDAGTYCILARNAYGCDRAFVTVVVRQRASSDHLISDWTYPTDTTIIVDERRYKSVPNRIPGELSVVDGGSNWISLAWPKVDPEGGAPVLAYKIESWLLGKEGGARWIELGITPLNSFEAYNLKQGEEYHFRVTPRNRYGWGESVQTSTSVGIGLAGDRPEFVEVLPGQLKVLLGETATLKCSFKGKPTPEIVWMKNGHEIDEENQRLKTCINNYNCSLTIHDVQINDEARYSCEATNVHGRASTYARVAVVTDKSIWEADTKLKRERSSDGGECPPQFTMRLRDRRVQATYPVRLTCQVIGRPPPLVTWYKNGKEVIDDDRRTKSQDEHFHTLEIAPTTLEDGGVYEATARNGSGAISCRCNLVVDKGIRAYIAPEFCCGLEPLYQLSIGQELRISAVVEAYPSVGVTWYRDGVRLRPSRRAVMTLDRDGQIELAVGSVTQRDAGVYTCTASNEVGKASTSGKVEVFGESDGERKQAIPTVICSDAPYSREPTFIRKPRSSEAYEGDTIIIECEVTGDPKPDVFWLRDFLKPDYYRDGSHFKRVGDGPEYRFEIPHAKLDYTGAYSVVARNEYGEAKAVISLQILAKDPRSTEEAHNIRYGRVEVIPRFEKELTDLLSHDGDAVEFECRVTGEPEPDIKWYHYTKIIRECSEFETSYELGTARLKIKQVTADDEGSYTCEAYNYLGKAISKACLVVYPAGEPNTLSQRLRRPPVLLSAASTPRSTPARSISRTRTPGPDLRSLCSPAREIAPKFYTYPYNKVAEEGDTVVFQCAAKGLPAPWATWDKDGVVITPSSRITIKEKDEIFRILEIDEVNSEDVGLYRVTLENDYGRAEATARLDVISQKGKFYASGRSYSASPRKSLPYKRSIYSLPRQD